MECECSHAWVLFVCVSPAQMPCFEPSLLIWMWILSWRSLCTCLPLRSPPPFLCWRLLRTGIDSVIVECLWCEVTFSSKGQVWLCFFHGAQGPIRCCVKAVHSRGSEGGHRGSIGQRGLLWPWPFPMPPLVSTSCIPFQVWSAHVPKPWITDLRVPKTLPGGMWGKASFVVCWDGSSVPPLLVCAGPKPMLGKAALLSRSPGLDPNSTQAWCPSPPPGLQFKKSAAFT